MTITKCNDKYRFYFINKNNYLVMIANCIDSTIFNTRSCLISDNEHKIVDQLYVKFKFGILAQNKMYRCHY